MTSPAHVSQLDGSAWQGAGCMGAVGAMALDSYTGGRIRVSMHDIRRAQDDQAGGIGLDDVATAWRRGWKLPFQHGGYAWATILGRLGQGQGVAITANYGALGSWRAPGSTFAGAHALWLDRPGIATERGRQLPGIVVNDPLRRGPVTIPEYVVKRAYTGGAGWGQGTYQAPGFDPVGDAADAVTAPVAAAVESAVAGIGDAIGHGALLAAIAGLGLLGVWLTFREPLTVAAGAAVRARTGGLLG